MREILKSLITITDFFNFKISYRKWFAIISISSLIIIFTLLFLNENITENINENLSEIFIKPSKEIFESKSTSVPNGYLVWNPQCKIPDLNPFAKDVMKLFEAEKYKSCSSIPPLTSIEQDFKKNIVRVIFHDKFVTKYLVSGQHFIECCYQEITRKSENKITLSKCTYFNKTFELPMPIEFILIQCRSMISNNNRKNSKTVYSNAHAVIRQSHETKKTFDKFKTLYPKDRPLGVLMIGIDSISRSNLIRAMPNTAQHLNDTGWFELKGYNKIDDNTFPNLMAILTGYNNTLSYNKCKPYSSTGELEKCPFIWKYFEESGYVTSFAEDEAEISTFNYKKNGFMNQPTTHYFRPFAIAAEKYLKIKLKHSMTFCLGYQNYADFIYQYAVDYATAYRNDPFFGLFWANTFSHNGVSDPSSMDLKIKNYLEDLNDRGVLNTSMVIFLSDHGLRFGDIAELYVSLSN
jgi:hypothetical protein